MKGLAFISKRDGWVSALLLIVVLGWMFREAWAPGMVVFSNDGPLSNLVAEYNQRPSAFLGVWQETQWLGKANGAAPINLSWVLLSVLDPVTFAKIYPFFTLVFFGMAFWLFLRTIGVHPVARILGSLVAGLNSDFFSYVCWGLGPVALSGAFFLLGLASLNLTALRPLWMRYVLAGASIGLAVMEGFDAGAILAVYLAIYAFFQALLAERSVKRGVLLGTVRVVFIALIAGWVATQTLYSLVSTQVKDVSVLEDESPNEQSRWDWATQWSLPINEVPRLIVPGLFGFRMDTPDGGAYFGAVGRSPGWEENGAGLARHSGSGFYLGISVFAFALFGVYQSVRGSDHGGLDRRWIWFWGAIALISLGLSLGRHFFLYKLFYQLPLASTIRNPIKFLHPMSLAWLMLAVYGLDYFARRTLSPSPSTASANGERAPKGLFSGIPDDVRAFSKGLLAFVAGAFLVVMIVASNHPERVSDLTNSERLEPLLAQASARFSLMELGWSLAFLVGVAMLFLWAFKKGGERADFRPLFFGLVVLFVLDLGRANAPWVVVYDQGARYRRDALVEILMDRRYEGRVTIAPYRSPTMDILNQVYRGEWLQHQFAYYNIQTLELTMEPRRSSDDAIYRAAFPLTNINNLARLWRLTNTRYVLAEAEVVAERLNQDVTLEGTSFSPLFRFKLFQDESGFIRTEEDPEGPFVLLEFSGALPRARLYGNWKVTTDARDALGELAGLDFDPHSSVLLSGSDLETGDGVSAGEPVVGSVAIETYRPKFIGLKASLDRPAILSLNEKFHPDWKVWVDGKPSELLRSNFIMRGVLLDKGEHRVEMRYQPRTTPLLASLGALATVCVGILGSAYATRSKDGRSR